MGGRAPAVGGRCGGGMGIGRPAALDERGGAVGGRAGNSCAGGGTPGGVAIVEKGADVGIGA